jgi:LAO/AO transport system kinase
MELADLIVVNKADGDLLPAANRAASDLRRAVHLLRPKREGWDVEVLLASATEGTGIPEVWDHLTAGADRLRASGAFDAARADQAVAWMWSEVREGLLDAFLADREVQAELRESEDQIRAGLRSPTSAAQALLERLRSR